MCFLDLAKKRLNLNHSKEFIIFLDKLINFSYITNENDFHYQ